ncbi:zinc finger domain-containing ubiquitin ligase [Gigaspora margarita]|uniref:Zinc finger domain-containing ubiquitin ligase n=1 Tax=Gigaspora margarita TaxID=4874 RepID=A0A8H4AN41_GIGMA|nr:zinc finger domain-containing ubiquitin ligase [Gigaspora margarita]
MKPFNITWFFFSAFIWIFISSATLESDILVEYIIANSSQTYTMSIKNSSNSSTSPIICKLNCMSNPSPETEFNGSLTWWPPTSSLGNSLIVYIKCDGNSTLNIISAQGSNRTIAIILSYDGKPCTLPSTSTDIIIPLFNEVNNDCHSNKSDSNFPGIDATIKFNGSPNKGSVTTTSDSTAQGYQIAMVILYTVSGIVLGLFFIVVLINIIKNRFRPSTDDQDQDDNNPKSGITKAVLESFPVYFFTLRNNSDPKNPENEKSVDSNSVSIIKSKSDENSDNSNNSDNSDNRIRKIFQNHDDIIPEVIVEHHHNNSIISIPEIASPITEEQLTCPICLGDFESGEELRLLPCHHQYHTSCIDPWLLDISPLCPMCKADYTSWNNNSISTLNEIASRSSISIGSVGVLSEAIGADITTTTTQNEIDISTNNFPHFRWAKYLKAIRRAGRRRILNRQNSHNSHNSHNSRNSRNSQLQSRLSVGDVLTVPNQNTSRNNLSIDSSEESRIRRWTYSGG